MRLSGPRRGEKRAIRWMDPSPCFVPFVSFAILASMPFIWSDWDRVLFFNSPCEEIGVRAGKAEQQEAADVGATCRRCRRGSVKLCVWSACAISRRVRVRKTKG